MTKQINRQTDRLANGQIDRCPSLASVSLGQRLGFWCRDVATSGQQKSRRCHDLLRASEENMDPARRAPGIRADSRHAVAVGFHPFLASSLQQKHGLSTRLRDATGSTAKRPLVQVVQQQGEAVQRNPHDDRILVHAEGSFCLEPFNVVDSGPVNSESALSLGACPRYLAIAERPFGAASAQKDCYTDQTQLSIAPYRASFGRAKCCLNTSCPIPFSWCNGSCPDRQHNGQCKITVLEATPAPQEEILLQASQTVKHQSSRRR